MTVAVSVDVYPGGSIIILSVYKPLRRVIKLAPALAAHCVALDDSEKKQVLLWYSGTRRRAINGTRGEVTDHALGNASNEKNNKFFWQPK